LALMLERTRIESLPLSRVRWSDALYCVLPEHTTRETPLLSVASALERSNPPLLSRSDPDILI
jgi:hypothetical protein